ncbi:hypothetical protein HKD37_09G024712 [Glycine soja]
MFDNLNRILHFDYPLYKGSFCRCRLNNLTLLPLFHRLNSIAEIDDQKETWKEILAQMKNVDVQLNNVIFDVGHTYVIQNFEVEKNIGHYKATRHGFKINFVKETKVTPHEIPKTMYNFTMFDDIVSGSAYTNFLIDVIGKVVEIGPGSIMSCPLWESLALEFKDCFDRHVYGLVVLLLRLAKIKEARAIQNSMYGSQIFVNSDMKEILEFKDWLATSFMTLPSMFQILGYSVYSFANCFLHNAHVKCFDELSQLKKECICVTVATICKLVVANRWIYDGCPKYNKSADGVGSSFVCVGCGNNLLGSVFRVDVRVGQPHESAIFTLWERECYALIKETATKIKKHTTKVHLSDCQQFDFTKLISKEHNTAPFETPLIHVNPNEGYYSFYYLLDCEGSIDHINGNPIVRFKMILFDSQV